MPYKDPQARKDYQKRYREIQRNKTRQYAKKQKNKQLLKDIKTRSIKKDGREDVDSR